MNAEGRELPHWDMFKRRLWRTPGRWAIAQGLVWLVLTLWFPWEWLDDVIPVFNSKYQPNYSDLLLLLIGTLGFAWLYYVIAQGMSQLADTGGSTGWYSSTLTSTQALKGVLLTTLAQSSVTLVGLLAFSSGQLVYTGTSKLLSPVCFQLSGDFFTCYTFTALLLLRLPHFAFANACFSIALRNTAIGKNIPLLFTLAATTAIFIPSREFYYTHSNNTHYHHNLVATPLFQDQAFLLPLIGLLLVGILCVGLSIQAHRGLQPTKRVFLFVPVVAPMLIGLLGLFITINGLLPTSIPGLNNYLFNLPLIQPLHVFLTHTFPNLLISWYGNNVYVYNINNQRIFGVEYSNAIQWIWPVASYLISLVIWYCAALACLNAARFPTLPWRKLLSR